MTPEINGGDKENAVKQGIQFPISTFFSKHNNDAIIGNMTIHRKVGSKMVSQVYYVAILTPDEVKLL